MLLGVDSAAFVRRQFSLSSYANQGLKVCHSASSRPTPTLKKRIRWTPDLRNEFVKCFEHLGGPEKATPKAILKLMETNLLTIFHLQSHLQVHPIRYNSISSCFTTLLREQGPSAFWRGWAGKFFGYGVQGGYRFGLHEYFKRLYSDIFVDHNRSFIFFINSASAEVFANIALCPFKAIKVRVEVQPHFAKGLADGFPKLYASEGIHGFYRGLIPLWGRNLPLCAAQFGFQLFKAVYQGSIFT